MNSSKVFNDVITYLEEIVCNGEEIDYIEISRIAMSPASLFARIFIYISGVGISDYVKKRRLTLAGRELRNSGISVIDAAVKYGFTSHSAFTRAFKEHHGITPSEAKNKKIALNDYLPINYSDMRFIGGKRIMAEVKKIVYKETGTRKFIGHNRPDASFYNSGEIWKEAWGNGTYEKLAGIEEFCVEDIEPNSGVGLMCGFKDKENFELYIGGLFKEDTPLPEGLSEKHINKGTVAQIQIEGQNVSEIIESAYLLITEAIEKTGREIDFSNFYWSEVYTQERYVKPLNEGNKVIIDYLIPVK